MYFLVLVAFFSIANCFAESVLLSEQKFYRRCYSQLVQAPIPLKDPTMKKIKDGTLKAIDACIDLLEQAEMDNQGLLKSHPNSLGSIPQKILRTFFEFHNSWFSTNSLTQTHDYNEELNRGSTDVYDAYEQSYFLTRSLFGRSGPYSHVIQGFERLKSVRIEDKEHVRLTLGRDYTTKQPSRRVISDSTAFEENLLAFNSRAIGFTGDGNARPNEDFANAPLVSIGELIGIQPLTESFIVKNVNLDPLGASRPGSSEPALEYTYEMNRNHGGGILGLPSYFMMNNGHGKGVRANGTTKLPRRWVKAMMETFMCANFPTLRESDITHLIVSNSNTPFRKSASCVQCHATMDQAASVAGNLITGATDFFQISVGRNTHAKTPLILAQYNVTMGANATWVHEDDNNFHVRRPKGKLFTRLFNGELLDRNIESIDDLGKVITQTQDFYTCAAKRYFEFFTGINVPLYDKKDPRFSEVNRLMTADHVKNRQFVESLGFELQQDQSLKNLVRRILKSDYYRSESY
jgi:hypothetical protein